MVGRAPVAHSSRTAHIRAPVLGSPDNTATNAASPAPAPMSHECWATLEAGRGEAVSTPQSQLAQQLPESPIFAPHCSQTTLPTTGNIKRRLLVSGTYTIYQLVWKRFATSGRVPGTDASHTLPPMYTVTPLRPGVLEGICRFQ